MTVIGLLALLAVCIFGGDPFDVRERLLVPGTGTNAAAAPSPWQSVVTLQGSGTTTAAPFTIPGKASEWRVRWTCGSGHLLLTDAGAPRPIVDAACPGTGTGFGTQTGPRSLHVDADGPWHLDVEQRSDHQRRVM